MKRVVVFIILFLAVTAGILYFGISSMQSFSAKVLVACSNEGALRVLSIEKKGWPGEKVNDSVYAFNKLRYTFGQTLINATPLVLEYDGTRLNSQLVIVETMPDSSSFVITAIRTLSNNPLTRIQEYLQTSTIKKEIVQLAAALKQNFDGEAIVYGINIQMSRVKDSTMISTKKLMNHQPTVEEIYSMIDGVRNHIKKNGGEENNAPMLNVYEQGANQFLVMVAVPTKTDVKPNETYLLKRMLAKGFILVSDIEGGPSAIHKAEEAMKQYVIDHQKSSPAIPFQMLLTDRRTEPDTSKWKTRLYYPVMY